MPTSSSFLSHLLTKGRQKSEMSAVTEKYTLAKGDANTGWLRLTFAES